MMNLSCFDGGAILCPTNDLVEEVNEFMLSLLSGEEMVELQRCVKNSMGSGNWRKEWR